MPADVRGLKIKAIDRYRQVADDTASAMKAELRVRSPRQTGRLRASINTHAVRVGPSTFRVTLEAPVIQAATTNTGARPHVIRPRRARVLSFAPRGGGRVFTRIVHHPGNAGTHWWDQVVDRRHPIIRNVLARL